MKKILALLMAMAMLVSAAGCQSKGSGKEMSAEEVYKSAMEKTNALQDTDMTMNMDMNMAVGGEELTISSDIALKAAGLTTEEMQMNMSMGMELMGQAVDMNMYYKDGYFYTEMAGQKAKQAMDVEAAVDQVEDSTAMGGIGAAVNHPVAASSLTVEEALSMFTRDAAWAVREEKLKGEIEIGRLADLVVTDRNIFRTNPKNIMTAEIIMTVKSGNILYQDF